MTKRTNPNLEDRKEHAFRRLGTDDPRCAACGEDRWQALEAHHVSGQAYGDDLAIVCRNCHRVLSDAQRDHPPKQESHDPSLEAIGRFLLGLADMLAMVVEKLTEFGRHLIEVARQDAAPVQGAAS